MIARARATIALTSCASGDINGVALALAIIPALIVAHGITLDQVLAIYDLVSVHKHIFTAIVLRDESKALVIVEELDDACLGHSCKAASGAEAKGWEQMV